VGVLVDDAALGHGEFVDADKARLGLGGQRDLPEADALGDLVGPQQALGGRIDEAVRAADPRPALGLRLAEEVLAAYLDLDGRALAPWADEQPVDAALAQVAVATIAVHVREHQLGEQRVLRVGPPDGGQDVIGRELTRLRHVSDVHAVPARTPRWSMTLTSFTRKASALVAGTESGSSPSMAAPCLPGIASCGNRTVRMGRVSMPLGYRWLISVTTPTLPLGSSLPMASW